MLKLKNISCLFIIFFFHLSCFAQDQKIITNKAFYLLGVLNSSPQANKVIIQNAVIKSLSEKKQIALKKALADCNDVFCYSKALKWNDEEIKVIGDELIKIEQTGKLKSLIQDLKKSGKYKMYEETDTALLRNAWRLDATGINQVLATYIEGKKPKYPKIDSISFNKNDFAFKKLVQDSLSKIISFSAGKAFYKLPLQASLMALNINGRDEVARYEPLISGLNKFPFLSVKKTDWKKYKYSSILVPGLGPEEVGVALDPQGAVRCKTAATLYNEGKAPFIFVSGGHVHPNKTPFCEAIEMKKYMVDSLKIPADVIFIEPHARHTTTNLRNVNRMIYQYGLPVDKPVLTVTDANQSKYILGMDKRCIAELGYVPYQKMVKISDLENEYYFEIKSLQINALDVLDP